MFEKLGKTALPLDLLDNLLHFAANSGDFREADFVDLHRRKVGSGKLAGHERI